MRASFSLAFAAFAALGLASPGHAATISSTFNTNDEGWLTGDITSVAAPGNVTSTPTYNFTAGPPAEGYISTTDTANEVGFLAPSKFRGDLSSFYGGTVSFDITDNQNDNTPYAALVLYGPSGSISINHAPPSTSGFSHFSFAFDETSFVKYPGVGNPGNVAVTQAEFLSFLTNVTAFAIHADWHSGSDLTSLDNVVLAGPVTPGVPEASTWAMMLIGFAGLGVASYRGARRARAAA